MMRRATALAVACAALAASTAAGGAEFATPGAIAPQNLGQVAALLREDPYDLELLISFGTSKGGSAGHLALAIRDAGAADDTVYSANFYADRSAEHEKAYYTGDLMVRIPKMEYLYGTHSTVADNASFGLDFGEAYKRALVGIRVYGVPATEKAALASFFQRINDDYHARAKDTEYHDREIAYDYLRLNCAKTIGSAFHFGAGYTTLPIAGTKILPGRTRIVAALNANVPTEMAVKLLAEWNQRGYRLDAVLYKKYEASPYVDPHDDGAVAFKDLPNRFPSVLSRDFRKEQGHYQDYDNLYAMYLLYNLGKYSVRLDPATQALEVERAKEPMAYEAASRLAAQSAKADRDSYRRGVPFKARGQEVGAPQGNLYEPAAPTADVRAPSWRAPSAPTH